MIRRLFFTVTCVILLLCSVSLNAQSGKPKPSKPKAVKVDSVQIWRNNLATKTATSTDSLILLQKKFEQNLFRSSDSLRLEVRRDMYLYVDTLILRAKDTLTQLQRDSLRARVRGYETELLKVSTTKTSLINPFTNAIIRRLHQLAADYNECKGCKARTDFEDQYEDFLDEADSLTGDYQDTTESLMDILNDKIADKADTLIEKLEDYAFDMMDRRIDELYAIEDREADSLEAERYKASRMGFSIYGSSHSQYNGRDNGIKQSSISPSIYYRHRIGLSAQLATSFLSKSKGSDNLSLSLGYDWDFSKTVSGSLTYSRNWFKDSSQQSKAEIGQSFEFGINISPEPWSINLDLNLDIGTVLEPNISASTSYTISFSDSLDLYLEPQITLVAGAQSTELATRRAKRIGKLLALNKKYMNGLMDFEVSLPVSYQPIQDLELSASVDLIAPINVIDASTNKMYGVFNFGVSYTLRFFNPDPDQ